MVDKHVSTCAVRQERNRVQRVVREGGYPLVVVGNQQAGYRLGGEMQSRVVLFGPRYPRQRDALAAGQEKFGQQARRMTLKKAA